MEELSAKGSGHEVCPICATNGRPSISLLVYRAGFDSVALLCPRTECPYLNRVPIDQISCKVKNEQLSLTSVAEDYTKYCTQFLQELGDDFIDDIPPEIRAEYVTQAAQVKPTPNEINKHADPDAPAAETPSNLKLEDECVTAEVGDPSQPDSFNNSATFSADVSGGDEPRRVAKPKQGRKRKGESNDASRTRPLANKYQRQPKQEPKEDDSNELDAPTQAENSVVQKLRIRDMKQASAQSPAPTKAETTFTELATPVLVPNVLSKKHGRAEDLKVNSLMDFALFYQQAPQSKSGSKLSRTAKSRSLQPTAKDSEASAESIPLLGPKKDAASSTYHESEAKCGIKVETEAAVESLPKPKILATAKPVLGHKTGSQSAIESRPTAANCIKILATVKPSLQHIPSSSSLTEARPTVKGNENCGSMAFSRATVNIDKFKLPVEEVKYRGRPRGKKFCSPAATKGAN